MNPPKPIGGSPLHSAAALGQKDEVERLLAQETDVNAKGDGDATPLHEAAANGHREVVELLLANKADVDAKADDGLTPLGSAAIGGHRDIAQLLIAKGADINARTSEGWTPLVLAERQARLLRSLNLKEGQQHCEEVAAFLREHGGKK